MTDHVDQIRGEIVVALDDCLEWRGTWVNGFHTPSPDQELYALADSVIRSPLLARILAMLEDQHVLDMTADRWTVEHPLTCRLNGALNECDVLQRAHDAIDALHRAWGNGRFRVWLDAAAADGIDGVPS